MGEIHADYHQMDLLPQSLEDWVEKDHPARFIRAFVEALDLEALGFGGRQGEEGRPPCANEWLLKVWLYGYLARIRSTRELERACREHLGLLWLRGRHAPDHNTLWRFFAENRGALREVFRAGVQGAAAQGLMGMICHAVDGTKIRAVASRRRVEHRKGLEKALAEVEASIAEMEAAVEKAEQEEKGEYRLPERLPEAAELQRAIRESLGRMQALKRDHLPAQEGEARVMKCEGRNDPAYNAQAADAQAGIIVAQTAVNAETDHEQLVPMLEEVRSNLGKVAKEPVADGQYSTVQQLTEADRRGRRVEVSPQRAAGERQRAKRAGPTGRRLLRQRKAIIEAVFATLKQAMGFRRWTVRGLENVRTQWALLCTAFNLQKLYKHWAAGELALT